MALVRNRNKEIRRIRVGDIRLNPANHRVHPDAQKAALAGILAEVGFCGTLLGFELSDGTVRLLDGHARVEMLDPNDEVEVSIVDLDTAERRKVLATHDAIGALAEVDHQALEALIQQAQVESPALQAMLADLSERSLNGPADEGGPPPDESEAGQRADDPGPGRTVPETWQIVVTCASESQQREIYELLSSDGVKCRLLTL